MTIFKTKLDVCDYQTVELPQDYKIIHVAMQQNTPCIWYECTPDMPLVKVEILCFGTGYRMPDPGTPDGAIEHIGSDMEKSLFRVKTRGCGVFHVIATSFDYAAGEVTRELNAQDYGYSGDRVVTNVEFICREAFMQNGKRALYGDKDENHLMIAKGD